jgi:D-serine dehydratase
MLEEELEKNFLSPILFNLYHDGLIDEDLKVYGDFRARGEVIRNVKYARCLALLPKKETMLQGMTSSLIQTGRRMKMNVE